MMANNKPNKDDRSDNVEKLVEMKVNTIGNMEAAEETAMFSDGPELEAIRQKNARRKEAIDGFRREILDEAEARNNGYNK